MTKPIELTEIAKDLIEFLESKFGRKIEELKYQDKELAKRYSDIFFQHLLNTKIRDYVIVCDETNNPPDILEVGLFRIDIKYQDKLNWTYKRITIGPEAMI